MICWIGIMQRQVVFLTNLHLLKLECVLWETISSGIFVYNDEVHALWRARHRAERKCCHTHLDADHDQYVAANMTVKASILKVKKSYLPANYLMLLIRLFFRLWTHCLTIKSNICPSLTILKILVQSLLDLTQTRSVTFVAIWTMTQINWHFTVLCQLSCQLFPLTEFAEISPDEVRKVISESSNASCILDNHPTWLLKQHVEEHVHVITAINHFF